MGLEGEEVLSFVCKQQEYYKNERAVERATLAEECIDRERETEIERAVQAADALERDKAGEHESRVLELKEESGQIRPVYG